ncbi:MAG: hypothetical protein KF861_01330 [Planctomycetaceae bacterium]|nr:hypothetical protein [Planctomycetaceae bacterium]
MTNQRKDSAPAPDQALFACGAVLGVCLGFAAGHVSVWSRTNSQTSDRSLNQNWPGLDRKTDWTDQSAVLFGNGPVDSLTAGEPDPYFSHEEFRPESAGPIDVSRQVSEIRTATETSEAVPPKTLPDAIRATPIDEETELREEVTRSIIAQEMPHATAQELEVWFDVLRGLDAGDVKGILRMRKHVGGEANGMVAAPGSDLDFLESPRDIHYPPDRVVAAGSRREMIDCLKQIREIRLYNLCHADMIGFPHLEPHLEERVGSEGERPQTSMKVERVLEPGEFQETGRPLDVSIIGVGFFQVHRDGQTRLTRCGRLRVGEDRRLALATTSESWRLEPPIVIPNGVVSLRIEHDGRVTARSTSSQDETELGTIELMSVFDPAGLRYEGEALFTTTPASGEAFRLQNDSSLRQGGVERPSAAVMRDQLQRLEREEQLMQQLEQGFGLPLESPIPEF